MAAPSGPCRQTTRAASRSQGAPGSSVPDNTLDPAAQRQVQHDLVALATTRPIGLDPHHVSGAIALLFGILVLVFPKTSLLVIGVLFGLRLIITGILRLLAGISDATLEGWEKGLTITPGVLVIVAGIFFLRSPVLSIFTCSSCWRSAGSSMA